MPARITLTSSQWVRTSLCLFACAVAFLFPAPAPAHAASAQIDLFGHLDFHGGRNLDNPTFFSLGEADLYLSGALAQNVRGQMESVFEVTESGETALTLERLVVTYDFRDYLTLASGKFHTPVGYYNTAFHHGRYLETAASRPFIHRFEDDQGVLPTHSTGILLGGSFSPVGENSVTYNLGMGNGRGPNPTSGQTVEDDNANKSLFARIGFRPAPLHSAVFGVSAYLDRIPTGHNAHIGLPTEVDERIYATHLLYDDSDWEIMIEYLLVQHRYRTGRFTQWSDGTYAQVGKHVGTLTPYARIERIRSADDPYFAQSGASRDSRSAQAGVRWDPAQNLALKIEARTDQVAKEPDPTIVTAQVAFAF